MIKARKILLSVVLALCMAALAACGGGDPNPGQNGGDTHYSYSLTDTSITLNEEQTKQLGVNVTPSKEITPSFTSENPQIASVSESGLITAVSEGNTTVKVSVDGETLSCSVTVKAYTLNFTSLALITGQTKQLTVTKGNEVVTGVTYESKDSSVASVNASGLVTAAGVGETVITATVDGVSIVCAVKVAQDYEYALNKTSLDLALGDSEILTVNVTPDKEFDNPVVFTSSDTSVVTVGEGNGEVVTVGVGTATVTCMADGHELTCTVTVTEYTLSVQSLRIRMGETSEAIEVTANPEKSFTPEFSSVDESVATVSAQGVVTPVSIGNTEIKIKVGDTTLVVPVEVIAARTYGLNKAKAELLLGSNNSNTVELRVTVDPAGDIGTVTWDSSDKTVATVANGLVTAVGVGSATITAEVDGNTLECEVNVAIPATISAENASGKSYNLTLLDNDYYTVDWVYYGQDGYTERMAERTELIGAAPAHDRYFYDYQAPMSWNDGTTNSSATGRRDGRVYVATVYQEITINRNVSKIVAFVGAYNATNRVSALISGVELAEFSFTSSGSSVNQAITVVPDTDLLGEGENVTLTFRMERVGDNADNISMVAIAVIGKENRPEVTTTASMTNKVEMTGSMSVERNLTEIGTSDWHYLVFTGDDGGDSKKDGSGAILVDSFERSGNIGIGWDYKCKFTWTDGNKWTDNPKDSGDDSGSWGDLPDGDPGRGTNNCLYGDSFSIQVKLGVGTHKVYLYVTGWDSTYDLTVRDGNSAALVNEVMWGGATGGATHAYEVEITLTVTEEDTFTFFVNKLSGGNVGLAAIAVATQA